MAGINFELKKIFKQNNIGSTVVGIAYSSIITIGPTMISMLAIFVLYMTTGYMGVSYAERELLSSTLVYCFIFPVINTSTTGAVLSRYLADKFYEEKLEDILPSYYMGLLITVLFASILGIPFAIRLHEVGGVELVFVLVSYALFMIMNILFFSMTYLYATKDYKTVTASFIIGLVLGIFAENVLQNIVGVPIIYAILFGVTIGFFTTAILIVAYIKASFKECSDNYTECLVYMKKYWGLIVSNLFYYLGIYVHNFVFWTTPMQLVVADSYYTMQPYDMASSIALFTNISTIIIFLVMAETRFHEKYHKYIECIIGSTYEEMKRKKESMFRLLIRIIGHVFAIQMIITALIYLIVVIFSPQLGLNGLTMEIYPAMVVAYMVIFLMYGNIVFLYYFNDVRGAMYTSVLFFGVTLAGSLVVKELDVVWYAMGVLIGAISGWTFSYFRIRYMEKHFDAHMFCKVKVIPEQYRQQPRNVVYSKRKRQEVKYGTRKN